MTKKRKAIILGCSVLALFATGGAWYAIAYPFTNTLSTSSTIATGSPTMPPGGLVAGTAINIYYYNPKQDTVAGNIMCSEKGLAAVERTLPSQKNIESEAIQLLLQGGPSGEEAAAGLTTDFPLAGVALASSSLENGTLTLTFTDPNDKTSGGSCRVSVLRAAIEKTALQFPSVQRVEILPEELFQP